MFLYDVVHFCVTKLINLCFCLFQRSADGSSAEDGDGKFENIFFLFLVMHQRKINCGLYTNSFSPEYMFYYVPKIEPKLIQKT